MRHILFILTYLFPVFISSQEFCDINDSSFGYDKYTLENLFKIVNCEIYYTQYELEYLRAYDQKDSNSYHFLSGKIDAYKEIKFFIQKIEPISN